MADPFAINSPLQIRIGQQPPDNVPKELHQLFAEVYNAIQQLIQAFDTYLQIGQKPASSWSQLTPADTIRVAYLNRLYAVASEAIVAGAVVSLFNNAGTLNIRNANATDNTRPMAGYCSTAGGIGAGALGEVILASGLLPIIGVVIGTPYWLSTVNGQLTNVRPVAAGNIEQFAGIGVGTDLLFFNCAGYIQH